MCGQGRLQVAFVEIYNDDIRDLLGDSDAPSTINVRESPERGTFLENVQCARTPVLHCTARVPTLHACVPPASP